MSPRADVLVTADWLADRLAAAERDDPELVVLEVNADPGLYDLGHAPGAIGIDWEADLQAHPERDVPSPEAFASLLGECGVTRDSTVVLYGDHHNWFAAHAYWLFTYYGHPDVRLLDGGREHWIAEGYPTTRTAPDPTSREYEPATPRESIRAYREDVAQAIERGVPLVDVRTPAEFRGEVAAPPGSTETALKAGRIPGARNVEWSEVTDGDGLFRSTDDLRELFAEYGIDGEGSTITYCRIGERSAVAWIALSELLGYDAANYDGSWTEWGNLVGAPIATGPAE